MNRLVGILLIIIGLLITHEKTVMNKSYNINEFEGGVYNRLEIRVMDSEVSNEFQDIILSHYTMFTWNKSHRGSWQLFGHVHGMLDNNEVLSPNQIDVGLDSHNYTPISYEKVKEIITLKNLNKVKGNG